MSFIPFGGNKITVNPWLVENNPGSYLSMGLTAENVAKHYGITREEMDEFSYHSHRKALEAQADGSFEDEIVALDVESAVPGKDGKTSPVITKFVKDEGPRAVAGCDPMEMGIGPIYAIPKVLKMTGLTLDDIGVIELNEAFASQSLAILQGARHRSRQG